MRSETTMSEKWKRDLDAWITREEPDYGEPKEEMYPTECPSCEGSGVQGRRITVYEHGCGFGHDDIEEYPCEECEGTGQVLVPYEAPERNP